MTDKPDSFKDSIVKGILSLSLIAMGFIFIVTNPYMARRETLTHRSDQTPQPLIMKGGDPYIRALMRTISASESNVLHPYSVLYGGKQISDLSQHPDLCVPIVAGPNMGDCTTAAGRYQFLTTTWLEKARLYHPEPSGMLFWENYSFEAQYQDAVVYAWLKDSHAWGVDIPKLLKAGHLDQVLRLLSGTWTSLGYGIETNSMTSSLPSIYAQTLAEELQQTERSSHVLRLRNF